MRTRYILAPLALIIAAVFFFSGRIQADEKKYPIDVWLEKAIAKDSTNVGMRRATVTAEQMWDKQMNKTYAELMKRLTPEEKATLVRSQKAWLAFRDAEFKTITQIHSHKQGTMYRVMAVGDAYDIVKSRALQLGGYKALLDD